MAIHLDLRTYWNKTRDAAVRLWQRVDAFCTPVCQRVVVWRKSPRVGSSEWVVDSGEIIDGYNFAEIFTVIAFILCQIQILSFIAMLLFGKLPFDHLQGFMVIPELVLTVVLLIDFKQLFQREWWSTIWRTIVIVLFI